jgi:hypothetical protein
MPTPWKVLAISWAKAAVAEIREGLTPGPIGAPVQPGLLFFGIAVTKIQEQEHIPNGYWYQKPFSNKFLSGIIDWRPTAKSEIVLQTIQLEHVSVQ